MLKNFVITILFFLLCLTQVCFATVSLSVNPVDGSNSLRFDRMFSASGENKKEIHIRVNSTNGSRYQVFQRILEPIVNEKGDALNLQSIETQTLPNSNSNGTLFLQNSDHLAIGDQLLYSSSQSGASDSFMIGYSLNQNLINTGGSFRGRLVFTVRGLNDASSDQVTIDIFLETSSNFKISVRGGHVPNAVHIKSTDTSENTADFVKVTFTGNTGQEVRVYQQVESFPQDDSEQDLGPGVLQFDPQGNSDGLRMSGTSPLSTVRSLIYSSNKDEDSFIIYFLADATSVQGQDAGTYRGKINYIVETDQVRQEFPLNVQFNISPVFTLNITTPPGGVKFARVLPNSPPQDEEVLVTVLSNLHKPYQVMQDLETGLTNQQGKEFNNKYFTLQVEIPKDQKGHSDYSEFSPMQTGEYPVFTSDPSGSGATFKVLYRLQGYPQMNTGNFIVPIRLSLNQK